MIREKGIHVMVAGGVKVPLAPCELHVGGVTNVTELRHALCTRGLGGRCPQRQGPRVVQRHTVAATQSAELDGVERRFWVDATDGVVIPLDDR